MIDIFINFRTSYVNEDSGEEIRSDKKIWFQYLKGRFWVDLISSLPTDIILLIFSPENDVSTVLIMLKLMKLIRLARLSRVITYLNLQANIKMTLRLGKLIFFLILYLHLIGWFWFYIARQDEKWIPPYYEFSDTNDIYQQSDFVQYITSLYYSVLFLAGNDLLPQGTVQILFATIAIFAAAIINANIFGNIAVLLQQINRKNANFQEKLELANTTMKNLRIPERLQKTIQQYLTSTESTLDQQKEFDSFLSMLSPSLKIEVTKHIFHNAILSNPVFDRKTEIIDDILHNLNTCLYFPENEIWSQGTIGRELYFLAKGEWDVFVKDENSIVRYITTLQVGFYFGEVALLKECPRTATVKSKNYSTCASLDKEKFNKLLLRYTFLRRSMEKYISDKYQDRWRKFIKRTLRNVEYLNANVTEEIIEEISYKLEIRNLTKGDYLFKVGDTCKEIYILWKGRIELLISNNRHSSEIYLDTIYTGWSIGSYSAINADQHTISGKALTDCTVLKLKYMDLETMRIEYDELDDSIEEYEKYIGENGLPYCDYKFHRGKEWNISPIEKFQNGINRIIRIIKSYKANTFTDLLKKVQEKIKEERKEK